MVLAPHIGTGKIDLQIARLQSTLRNGTNGFHSLENLGWLFVAKARESFDPGYYKLAEHCALCLDSRQPNCPEALLLRGHVLQNLHKFKEAEPLARELVARRGLSFDYGLLGDVEMEQGNLTEAAEAYQKMVDQRPDLQAYARISWLRWLKGDVGGATEVMQLAVSAASPNSPETAAWVNTRLALLQFQAGHLEEASQTCSEALSYEHQYPPALLLRGRLLLAEGKAAEAEDALQSAAALNPLPDYQWVLSEALQAAGRGDEAATVRDTLRQNGAAADPRTYELYLASRGESPAQALELANDELRTRRDVFTHDALAWSLAANGRIPEARTEMALALAEGTQDGRLFLHAAVIAEQAGAKDEAQQWLSKAAPMLPLLLPSEQERWQSTALALGSTGSETADASAANETVFTPAN
jgi:tetratricopeptide (TPR) repeat protein